MQKKKYKRVNKYRVVAALPPRALKPSVFVIHKGYGLVYLYKLWGQHKKEGKEVDFEIVVFKGRNYVIPKRIIPEMHKKKYNEWDMHNFAAMCAATGRTTKSDGGDLVLVDMRPYNNYKTHTFPEMLKLFEDAGKKIPVE